MTGGDGGQNADASAFTTIYALPFTLIVDGEVKGGTSGFGINIYQSNIDINVFVKTAIGNGAGINSNGALIDPATRQCPAINNATTTAKVYVENFICGSRGMFPTSGPAFFRNFNLALENIQNFVQFRRLDLRPITLSTPSGFVQFVPEERDVRSEVVYGGPPGFSLFEGTLNIPTSAQVIFGVPVDNTVGAGFVDVKEVWGVPVSALRTPDTIGDRLRNTLTINALSGMVVSLNI
jgi:hypothetical protein